MQINVYLLFYVNRNEKNLFFCYNYKYKTADTEMERR